MMTFMDTSFCSAECARTDCDRHMQREAKHRTELKALAFLPTAWCDFSQTCGMYEPLPPEAE